MSRESDYILHNVFQPEKSRAARRQSALPLGRRRLLEKVVSDTLDKLIQDGQTARYETEYRQWQNALPDEACDICKGTGQRDDAFVQGKCNACEGAGTVKAWLTNYPFEVDNVKEFAEFCRESGGFRIC